MIILVIVELNDLNDFTFNGDIGYHVIFEYGLVRSHV